MTRRRRRAATALVVLLAMVAIAGCGGDAASPTWARRQVPPRRPVSAGAAVTDLAAIGCATEDPTGVGELTGAWQGNDSGVYYIRHVGDCVWWFGTEVDDIEPGIRGSPGLRMSPPGAWTAPRSTWNGPTFRLDTSSTEGA